MRPLIEVMSEAMHDLGDWNPQESAEYVERRLRAAGYRIAGPEDRVIGKREIADIQRFVEQVIIAARDEGRIDNEQGDADWFIERGEEILAAIRNLGEKA